MEAVGSEAVSSSTSKASAFSCAIEVMGTNFKTMATKSINHGWNTTQGSRVEGLKVPELKDAVDLQAETSKVPELKDAVDLEPAEVDAASSTELEEAMRQSAAEAGVQESAHVQEALLRSKIDACAHVQEA